MPAEGSYRLTTIAENDLFEIIKFTRSQWGHDQALAYAELMYTELERLGKFPELGQRRTSIRAGLRSVRCGQHTAFYRIVDGEIIVERLLHPRQKINRNLFSTQTD